MSAPVPTPAELDALRAIQSGAIRVTRGTVWQGKSANISPGVFHRLRDCGWVTAELDLTAAGREALARAEKQQEADT